MAAVSQAGGLRSYSTRCVWARWTGWTLCSALGQGTDAFQMACFPDCCALVVKPTHFLLHVVTAPVPLCSTPPHPHHLPGEGGMSRLNVLLSKVVETTERLRYLRDYRTP